MYTYQTSGTCSRSISFDIIDGKLHNVSFVGGCPGNLKSIGKLVEGMEAQKVAELLRGVKCGSRPTSCGDQLSQAILEHL